MIFYSYAKKDLLIQEEILKSLKYKMQLTTYLLISLI